MARRTPKFGDLIRDQQVKNPDLHYVNYRCLDRAIGRNPPPVDMIDTVNAEICKVNTSFENKRLELLEIIVGLRKDVELELQKLQAQESGSIDAGCSPQFWQNAKTSLVEVLQALTRLRQFAEMNWEAITKIHHRWRKLEVPTDIQKDKNLQLVIERLQADPDEWLRLLRYYDGLEFAELYCEIKSLQATITGIGQGCESVSASRTAGSAQSNPDSMRSGSVDIGASGSDSLAESIPEVAVMPGGIPKASLQCIACLAEIPCSSPALGSQSLGEGQDKTKASPAARFVCGHWVCRTCFNLGRTSDTPGTAEMSVCAICKYSDEFTAEYLEGLRSFRGILCQFSFNTFFDRTEPAERCQLRNAEQQQVGVIEPTAPLCSQSMLAIAAK